MKHLNVRISGRVQGVYYRATAMEKALELGVCGFVRNQDDGSVYMEVEAEDYILHQFLDWCRRGPRHASVDEVHAAEGSIVGFKGFQIAR